MTNDFERAFSEAGPEPAKENAGVKENWGYKTIRIRAVIAHDNEGNYLIHGSSDESYQQMAKAMAPIWDLNPDQESMQSVEFDLEVPDLDIVNRPRVKIIDPS